MAKDSLINLTNSSLFLVSALQDFGVEIEHIILLSETEEQLALCKHKQTTAVFTQLLESASVPKGNHFLTSEASTWIIGAVVK